MLKLLKREKSAVSKKLKDSEERILHMQNEYTERISQLKSRLEFMTIDAEQQKSQLLQQKHKERERLDKIAEVSYFSTKLLVYTNTTPSCKQ
jgi:nucleoside-triphosphatase THEP1